MNSSQSKPQPTHVKRRQDKEMLRDDESRMSVDGWKMYYWEMEDEKGEKREGERGRASAKVPDDPCPPPPSWLCLCFTLFSSPLGSYPLILFQDTALLTLTVNGVWILTTCQLTTQQ